MDQRAKDVVSRQAGAWSVVVRLVEADGTAAQPWLARLTGSGVGQRDLSDAVHALCVLYGHQPSIADEARGHEAMPAAADWLARAAAGLAGERGYLAQLTAASGPLPSTPGHAETHAAITAQAHALSMLARSDRGGCAVGAVAALLADWTAVRRVLDAAADRFGVARMTGRLPTQAETGEIITELGATPACERAIGFGAQQLLAQHRGLWSLLEARASARHG